MDFEKLNNTWNKDKDKGNKRVKGRLSLFSIFGSSKKENSKEENVVSRNSIGHTKTQEAEERYFSITEENKTNAKNVPVIAVDKVKDVDLTNEGDEMFEFDKVNEQRLNIHKTSIKEKRPNTSRESKS